MNHLYIVRHGDAVHEGIDPRRPLSDQGRHDVLKVAQILKEKNVSVPAIYHSGKLRAEETARLLAAALNPACKVTKKSNLLPDDPVEPIFEEINRRQEDLMIVGHLPYVGMLTAKILAGAGTGGPVAFRPASVAVFKKDKENRWTLKEVVTALSLSR